MRYIYYLISASFCLASFSCGKDSSDDPAPTKTEIITKASWKYDNAGIDFNKDGTLDSPLPPSFIDACVLDNSFTLAANGTGTVDEGAAKCNSSAPQTTPLTWSFANNEMLLNVGGGGILGYSGQFKIVELSGTKLTLSKDTTIGVAVAIIANFKH